MHPAVFAMGIGFQTFMPFHLVQLARGGGLDSNEQKATQAIAPDAGNGLHWSHSVARVSHTGALCKLMRPRGYSIAQCNDLSNGRIA